MFKQCSIQNSRIFYFGQPERNRNNSNVLTLSSSERIRLDNKTHASGVDIPAGDPVNVCLVVRSSE